METTHSNKQLLESSQYVINNLKSTMDMTPDFLGVACSNLTTRDLVLGSLFSDDTARGRFYEWWQSSVVTNTTLPDMYKPMLLTILGSCLYVDQQTDLTRQCVKQAIDYCGEGDVPNLLTLVNEALRRGMSSDDFKSIIVHGYEMTLEQLSGQVKVNGPVNLMNIINDIHPLSATDKQTIVICLDQDRNLVSHGDFKDASGEEAIAHSDAKSFILIVNHLDSDLDNLESYIRGQRGLHHLDTLIVKNDTWRSRLCINPSCCPPEGKTFPSSDTNN